MCYKKVIPVSLGFLFLFASVQGSCLEYGHSCWGAHGKRSGASSTLFRGGSDLTAAELQLMPLPDHDEGRPSAAASSSSSSSNKVGPRTAEGAPADDVLSAPPLQGLFERFPDAEPESPDVDGGGGERVKDESRHRAQASRLRRLLRQRQPGRRAEESAEEPAADRWRRVSPLFHLKTFAKQSAPRPDRDLFRPGPGPQKEADEGGFFDYN